MGFPDPYKRRKFDVGERLLALRTRARLTQVELAALIGAGLRSVQGWEAGAAYPQEDKLRQLITVFLTEGALTPGQEYEEAFALWQLVSQDSGRRLARFDEKWFAALLAGYHRDGDQVTAPAPQDSSTGTDLSPPQPVAQDGVLPPFVDWGEAPDVAALFGRETELATLHQWVVADRCRVVALLGLGGIGKTSLVMNVASNASTHFDGVFFRSLRNAPPLSFILDGLIHASSTEHSTLPESVADKIALLIQLLRERRYLVILDNLETILQPDAYAGEYRAGYEEYGLLVQRLGEIPHRSCLLLTSREKPAELGPMEGRTAPVRSLVLTGLADDACRAILEEKELFGTEAEVGALAHLYAGNPLALKLISEPIQEVFSGNLHLFLSTGDAFFNGVGKLLDQQFQRLTPMEQVLLYWLAIERDFVTLEQLQANNAGGRMQRDTLIALESLRRRLLIERRTHPPAFSLQSVIMEYLTDRLVEQIRNEIVDRQPHLLRSHALIQATAKDYVRRSQEQLIARPLLEQLMETIGRSVEVEQLLVKLLQQWRGQSMADHGYGPGNVVNLLRLLRGHLRHLDLTHLAIRQAYLQGVEVQDTSLAGSTIQECTFTESFTVVYAVASTLSGTYWAASSINGSIHVWRDGGRTTHLSIPAHANVVLALTFDPDEKILASGSWDCTIKLWDIQSGELISTLEGHLDYVQDIAFSPDGHWLASGSDDQTLRIWDVASGLCLTTIHAHSDNTYGVAWSPDGAWIVTCGFDCVMRLWNVADGLCVKSFVGHTQPMTKVAFSPDGQMLASGSFDHTVRIWDVASGGCIQLFTEHSSTVIDIDWSSDGRTIASCSFDGTIRLWTVSQNNSQRILLGHGAHVYSIAFTASGNTLLSGSDDQTMRVWDVTSGWCVRVLKGYGLFFFGVVWSPDGNSLLSANSDATLTVWNVADGSVRLTLRGHQSSVYAPAWSPDGRWLASAGFDQTVRIWDATTGNCVRIINAHSDIVYRLVWSRDGRWLASTGRDQTVKVWDATTWICRSTARGHTGPIKEVVWSPDAQQLASCSEDRTVRLWSAEDGTLLQTLSGHNSAVAGVAWSPDGQQLASCGGGGSVGELFVWNPATGELLNSIPGIASLVTMVAWSHDSKVLLTGGFAGSIHWWDVASGAEIQRRQDHLGWVHSLSVSPDGSMLASSGKDGVIHLREIKHAELIHTLRIDRPYERMDIRSLSGITGAQHATLMALGAIEGSN